jgi:hypothetical protein
LQNRIDRFLLGIVYKSAGIDDDDVVVLAVGLMARIDAIAPKLRE